MGVLGKGRSGGEAAKPPPPRDWTDVDGRDWTDMDEDRVTLKV